jgi:transcriptional regulator with XRE-family HTH domain
MITKSEREQKISLGQMLVAERKKQGINQAIAAERLNVTKGAYQAWELGRSMPDIKKLQKIALFLNFQSGAELIAVLEGSQTVEEVKEKSFNLVLEIIGLLSKKELEKINLIVAQEILEKI